MTKSFIPRSQHILEAIDAVHGIIRGRDLIDIESNRRDRMAFERGFEIISEASRHLPEEMKLKHDHIPWKNVAGIGNVLRHGYESIEIELLFKIAVDDLTALERVCRTELDNAINPVKD